MLYTFLNVYPKFIGELMTGVSSPSEKVRNISLSVLEMILSRLEDISSDLFENLVEISSLICSVYFVEAISCSSFSKLIFKLKYHMYARASRFIKTG